MENKKKAAIAYSEPSDYFPESVRRKFKIGEFAETNDAKKETNKKKTETNKKK